MTRVLCIVKSGKLQQMFPKRVRDERHGRRGRYRGVNGFSFLCPGRGHKRQNGARVPVTPLSDALAVLVTKLRVTRGKFPSS